jgi:hypothetical protein
MFPNLVGPAAVTGAKGSVQRVRAENLVRMFRDICIETAGFANVPLEAALLLRRNIVIVQVMNPTVTTKIFYRQKAAVALHGVRQLRQK